MRASRLVLVVLVSIFTVGCTTTQKQSSGATYAAPNQVRSPVAQQALGPGAVPVNVEFGQQLKVPAIYRISSQGQFSEICPNDFAQQNALKAIRVEERRSTDTIYDKLVGGKATLSLFGLGTLSFPYAKTKVDGFMIKSALTPTADDVADYILANLGETCSKETLNKAPYFVVTGLAVADRAYTISREAVGASIPLWGLGSLDYANDENIEGPRTDVTFGVRGLWVRPGS
jgi:hypothetical protein